MEFFSLALYALLLLTSFVLFSTGSFSRPLALPIVGHLYLLGKLPHHALARISAKYGPLIKLKFGSVPVLIASSPDMARAVFKVHDLVFSSRPFLLAADIFFYKGHDMVFAPYGETWRKMKKLVVSELLSEKRVASLRSQRLDELTKMILSIFDQTSQGEPSLKLAPKLTEFVFNTITRMAMNKVYFGPLAKLTEAARQEADHFLSLQDQVNNHLGKFHIGDFVPWLRWLDSGVAEMESLHEVRDEFLQKILDEHRRSSEGRSPDFVDTLLSLDQKDTTIKSILQNVLGAGTDTSITTLLWAMTELLNHPNALRKVQEELDAVVGRDKLMVHEEELEKLTYFKAVVKETFRMHPPSPLLLPHAAVEDCVVGSVSVRRGTLLMVNAYVISRDPTVYESPDEFIPERFLGSNKNLGLQGQDFELIPFGSGRRGCPGTSLGLSMVHVCLGNMLHCFNWSLPPGVSRHPTIENPGVTCDLAVPLVAHVEPRLPLELYKA